MSAVLADCGKPVKPKNGRVKFNGTLEGSFAKYRCNKGCILGDIDRICESSGHWSGHIPECHRELIIKKSLILLCVVIYNHKLIHYTE